MSLSRLNLKVPPELLDRVEAWRRTQPARTTLTAAIVYLIGLGLEAAPRRTLTLGLAPSAGRGMRRQFIVDRAEKDLEPDPSDP